MKYIKATALIIASTAMFVACDKDELNPGNPVMEITGSLGNACFGDSLRFGIKATDNEVPLSTIHADLYFGSEKVSEQVIRTKVSGEVYECCVYIPYIANIPDGQATLNLTLQNINFTTTQQALGINLTHADYPQLTFKADNGNEYTMVRDSQYNYSVTDNFDQEMKGTIIAPAIGEYGNEIIFGYEGSEIKVNGMGSIPFSNSAAGNYTISFNTYSFEGAPFVELSINGELLSYLTDTSSSVDLNLSKGDPITFDGFPNFEEWWLNPDYFQDNGNGTYSFMAYDGNYRIIADTQLKYFSVVKLSGGQPATLNEDGTGAVWILGDGIGYPSLSNAPSWNPGKGICMAPTSDKTYQVTVVGGRNIDASSINFKFFGQDGWGTELTGDMLKSESNLIGVGKGQDVNGHDSGNLFLEDGVTLDVNGIYVITLDLTGGINNAILRVDLNGESEFDEKAIYINGQKMITADNAFYSLMLNMNQNEVISFRGFNDLNSIYMDPDYFAYDRINGSISFRPISGYYNIKLNIATGLLSAVPVNEAGTELTLQDNGSGEVWLMGWGVGSPSMDYQFGWTEGQAYGMSPIAPGIYQFTGNAGPENGSSPGDRFRTDYLSFKFFWQNGWGGEFNNDNPLTLTGTAAEFIHMVDGGNFELNSGVNLTEGSTYRLTVDLSGGAFNGTINFEQL